MTSEEPISIQIRSPLPLTATEGKDSLRDCCSSGSNEVPQIRKNKEISKSDTSISTSLLNNDTDTKQCSSQDTGKTSTKWNRCSYSCGLFSADDKVKRRSRIICCGSLFIILVIMLPVTFLVIIPLVIQNFVNASSLTLESATISNPTDASFQSTVVQKFSQTGPVPATIQFTSLSITWNGPGGGTLATLTDCSKVAVSSGDVTMSSLAIVQNETALQNFNKNSINSTSSQWIIAGSGTVVAAGLSVAVDISKQVTLTGFDGFPIAPVITGVVTTGGSASTLFNTIQVTLESVANIAINFGQNLCFAITSNGIPIGSGYIPDASFALGAFNVTIYSSLQYNNDGEYNELSNVLAAYSAGRPSPIRLQSFYTAQPISWLQPALASMKLDSHIPGISSSFLQKINLFVPKNPADAFVQLQFYNPIATTMTFNFIHSYVYCNITGSNVFFSTLDAPGLSIVVQPNQVVLSPNLTTTSPLNSAVVQTLTKLEEVGTYFFQVFSNTSFLIGQFPANISYSLNVPVVVTKITT